MSKADRDEMLTRSQERLARVMVNYWPLSDASDASIEQWAANDIRDCLNAVGYKYAPKE